MGRRDHLSSGLQERCVPRHILEALNVWLTDQCESHSVDRTSRPVIPSPFVRSAPDPPRPRSPFGPLSQPGQVFNVVPKGGNLPPSSPVVASHPFVGVPTQGGQPPATVQFSGGGPVRLTRFVEMSLDSYYAHLNQMISLGRFEHIGRASIHLERATAWSVWLRVDQWSSALGNRLRLRCGALYHVANRTVARDAARLLVPLFEGWTVPSISQLPSVCREHVDVVPPVEPLFQGQQSSHSVASPVTTATLPPVQLHAQNDESRSLRNMVHQLIDVCRAYQSHLTGLREEVTTLRSLVNALTARPPLPPPAPFRSPGQPGGYWSSARSPSVEGQADWTSAPCVPPRRLLCSSSEPMSCAVLSRSLHQPKMQCSCTTDQITGETLPLPRVSSQGPRRVLERIL